MANQTGACTAQREQKNIVDIDLYDRYEVTGTNIAGTLYVKKGVTFDASDTCTLTKA